MSYKLDDIRSRKTGHRRFFGKRLVTTFAYLRVSTDRQDLDNQRHGILEYANSHRLGPLAFVEDAASGRIGWRDRAVGALLLETASGGDVVLFAEVSRMGRSTLQVLEMLETCMTRGLTVHIAKQGMRGKVGKGARLNFCIFSD
jgi:DNA invertase Pin-like site-specific DNA recombinase